ncbi:MAG TPA: hypothetical protein DCG49_10560 [Ruminococcus sp.]|nr:hypothetical protein [Ruminococcus sp.]
MKKKMRMAAMLTCAAMLCSGMPAVQVQAAKQKDVSDLYYFGLADGEMFRDMEIVDDKGMLQWIVTGEGYGTKDTPYYVCTYHLDRDFTRNVQDADSGEIKQETYHVSRQMLYVVVPRQNYLRFELRNDIDEETASAQAAAIVSGYDENARLYWDSDNPNIRACDILMPDHTGSAEISEAIMNELNDAGLISAFYTWGQSALFHEVEHGQLPTGYLPFIEQYHVDEWLTEYHPEYSLMQVTEDSEYANQLTFSFSWYSTAPEYVYAVIPPEGASFGEQLAVTGELYEAFGIRPEFYVQETSTETLAGKNALTGIPQPENDTLAESCRRIAGWDNAKLSDCVILADNELLTPEKAYNIDRARWSHYRVFLKAGTTLDEAEVLDQWKALLRAEGYPEHTLENFTCQITETDGGYYVSVTQSAYKNVSLADCLRSFPNVECIDAQYCYHTQDRPNHQFDYCFRFTCDRTPIADDFSALGDVQISDMTYGSPLPENEWYLTLSQEATYSDYFNAAKYLQTLDFVHDLHLVFASTELADTNEDAHILFPEPDVIYHRGDVTEDGAVDVADAVLLARFCAEDSTAVITDQGKQNADVNHDGNIELDDVTATLRKIAKLD